MRGRRIALLTRCGRSGTAPGSAAPRHYRKGLAARAPRFESDLVLAAHELWTRRADAALIGGEALWDATFGHTLQ